jgi:hypothetical protein
MQNLLDRLRYKANEEDQDFQRTAHKIKKTTKTSIAKQWFRREKASGDGATDRPVIKATNPH